MAASNTTPTEKKLDELYDLIDGMNIALLTTRRRNGQLVTRPMSTQDRGPHADLWFVTSIETHKIDEIEAEPEVSVGYFDSGSMEWVSVSGRGRVTQDRAKIRELWQPDWKAWFEDEGGDKDGSADDPRLALIYVDAHSVHYMKAKHTRPRALFEIARGVLTGTQPDLGREEHLSEAELRNR